MNRQILCLLLMLGAGCESRRPPGKAMPPEPYVMPAGEEPTRTIVTFQPDGSPTVKVEVISEQTYREDFETRQRLENGVEVSHQGVTHDPGCGNRSIWIFDNIGNTPGSFPFNHEICFDLGVWDGCVDLKPYTRYCTLFGGGYRCQYWAWSGGNSIGSFWAGANPGFFAGPVSNCDPVLDPNDVDLSPQVRVPFTPYERRDNAQQIPNFPSEEAVCICGH